MSAIEVQGLQKTFRVHKKLPGFMGSVKSLFNRQWIDKEALKGVDLKVNEGEIIGLLGANGAGKTTLVKILSGIIHPSEGNASVMGFKPWERKNDYRRQISLIMGQKAQLWWDLPAADSFDLLQEIYQIDKAEHKRTLEYLIETLGVQDQVNIQVRRLSLGERMKMELIAALLHKPKVVFLDEPTIGLDLTAQRAIRKFLAQYLIDYKPAMILTSHYMEDIEQLCKRIAVIKEGEIVYDGSLNEVVNRFAQDRVVNFVVRPEVESVPDIQGVGERCECELPYLKYKVKRNQMADAISKVMQTVPIRDISIEEDDVANIIESLIRRGLN